MPYHTTCLILRGTSTTNAHSTHTHTTNTQYLYYVPRLNTILLTILMAVFDLSLFGAVAAFIIFMFGSAFYVSFGKDIAAFDTIGNSCGALFRLVLGIDPGYPNMLASNQIMANFLFFAYIGVMSFVLLQMFLTILVEVRPRAAFASVCCLPKYWYVQLTSTHPLPKRNECRRSTRASRWTRRRRTTFTSKCAMPSSTRCARSSCKLPSGRLLPDYRVCRSFPFL